MCYSLPVLIQLVRVFFFHLCAYTCKYASTRRGTSKGPGVICWILVFASYICFHLFLHCLPKIALNLYTSKGRIFSKCWVESESRTGKGSCRGGLWWAFGSFSCTSPELFINKLQKGVSAVANILLQQKTGISRLSGSCAFYAPVFSRVCSRAQLSSLKFFCYPKAWSQSLNIMAFQMVMLN